MLDMPSVLMRKAGMAPAALELSLTVPLQAENICYKGYKAQSYHGAWIEWGIPSGKEGDVTFSEDGRM